MSDPAPPHPKLERKRLDMIGSAVVMALAAGAGWLTHDRLYFALGLGGAVLAVAAWFILGRKRA